MMTMVMTNHVTNDRIDRMMAIAEHIGWGVELISVLDANNPSHILTLTSTGVLLIKSHTGHLITAYVPSAGKVRVMYSWLGLDHVPQAVYVRLQKSIKIMKKVGFY